jgi:hypothetical protein
MHIILLGAIIVTVGGFIGGVIVAIGTFKQNKASGLKTDSIKATGEQGLERIRELEKQNKSFRREVKIAI